MARFWQPIVLSVVLVAALPVAVQSESPDPRPLTPQEAYLLLAELIHLPTEADGLAQYKKLGVLRARFWRPATLHEMSIFLFLGFHALARADAHGSEEYTRHIREVYDSRSPLFLEALGKNQFLIESACGTLGEHFSFVDNDDGLVPFLKENEARIRSALYPPYAERCISAIRAHAV